ncbi:FHA domain-containing protein [Jonesiaceae bacterium BS-20]|uniref:FHA domain-containing protein n=1 Tax=Jonesiaceae bacterium BS-20 TaxID=3120821 RepID=A0AAU7DUL9_9MICO
MVQYYNPGAGTLIAAPEVLVYLPGGIQTAQTSRIWEGLIGAPRNLLAALEVLTGVLDPTYLALPEFVLIHFSGPVGVNGSGAPHRSIQVACRGQIDLLLRSHTGDGQTLTGQDATVWEESSFNEVTWISLGHAQRTAMPLLNGVAQAASFYWKATANQIDTAQGAPSQSQPQVNAKPSTAVPGQDQETDLGATLTEVPEDWLPPQSEDRDEAVDADPGSAVPAPKSTAPLLPSPPPPPAAVDNQTPAATAVMGLAEAAQPATAILPPLPEVQVAEPAQTSVIQGAYFGTVRFSHGPEMDLGAPIVVGRKPTIEGSGALPHARMVTVPSPAKDISRSHLGIHLDQGYVIATDLNSVNGTILRRGGQPERDLNPNEGTLILDGDILDLGDGVVLTFTGIG